MDTNTVAPGLASLFGIAPDEVHDHYDRLGLGRWSDRQLVGGVSRVLARPKAAPADSFVLHASLELLARTALLERVAPDHRDSARRRLLWLAATFDAAGEPVPEPSLVDTDAASAESVGLAAARLVAALEAGDLDDVDRWAVVLAGLASPVELQRFLAGPVVTSLAAAAHASILLYLAPRAAGAVDLGIIRGPLRELGRQPDWKIRWFEDPDEPPLPLGLTEALSEVPPLGLPGSTFIFPIMNQAEESGLAVSRLSGVIADRVDAPQARRELSRVAAWSMLQEGPEHAAYGWSHCLTMPQAVISLAGLGSDPRVALAVAATHVVGFRAALGHESLDPDHRPEDLGVADVSEGIASGREAAASAVWFTPDDRLDEVVGVLAANASRHHDAHLVKYTLACFDAADADPGHRRLYLTAAASLAGCWATEPGDALFG